MTSTVSPPDWDHSDPRVRRLVSAFVVADTANLIADLRVEGSLLKRLV
jgi:hypothetical protein